MATNTNSVRGTVRKYENPGSGNAGVEKQFVGADSKAASTPQRGSALKSSGTLRAATNKDATPLSRKPASSQAKPSQPSAPTRTTRATTTTARPTTGTLPRAAPGRTSDGLQTRSLTRQPVARPVLGRSTGPVTADKGTEPVKKVSAATLKRLAANKGAAGGGRPSTPNSTNSPAKPDANSTPSQSPSSKRSSTLRDSKTEDEFVEQSFQPEPDSSPVLQVEKPGATDPGDIPNAKGDESDPASQKPSADPELAASRRSTVSSAESNDSDRMGNLESTEPRANPSTLPALPVMATSDSGKQAETAPVPTVNDVPPSSVQYTSLDHNLEGKSDSLKIIELKNRVSKLAGENARKSELINQLFASQMDLKNETKEISNIPGGLKGLYDQISALTDAVTNEKEANETLQEEVAKAKQATSDVAGEYEKYWEEAEQTKRALIDQKLKRDDEYKRKTESWHKTNLERDDLIAKLKEEIGGLKTERDEALERILSAESKLQEVTTAKNAMEIEYRQFQQDQNEFRRISERHMAEWRQSLNEANFAWDEFEDQWHVDLHQLAEEVDNLQSQLKESVTASAELQDRLLERESVLEATLKREDDLKAAQEQLVSKIDSLSRELATWTVYAADATTFKESIEAAMVKYQSDYSRLHSKCMAAETYAAKHSQFIRDIAAMLGIASDFGDEDRTHPERRHEVALQELDRQLERHRCDQRDTEEKITQLLQQLQFSQRVFSDLYADITRHNCNTSKTQFAPPIKAKLFRTLERIATSQDPDDFLSSLHSLATNQDPADSTTSLVPTAAESAVEAQDVASLREAELEARKQTDVHFNRAKEMARNAAEILGPAQRVQLQHIIRELKRLNEEHHDKVAAGRNRTEPAWQCLDWETGDVGYLEPEPIRRTTPPVSEETARASNPTATVAGSDSSAVPVTDEQLLRASAHQQTVGAEQQPPEFYEPGMQTDQQPEFYEPGMQLEQQPELDEPGNAAEHIEFYEPRVYAELQPAVSEPVTQAGQRSEFHEPSMQADWVVMDRAEGETHDEDAKWEEVDTNFGAHD